MITAAQALTLSDSSKITTIYTDTYIEDKIKEEAKKGNTNLFIQSPNKDSCILGTSTIDLLKTNGFKVKQKSKDLKGFIQGYEIKWDNKNENEV